jgi:uncharacterized C2H2 Zn-finger protein
LAEFKCSVCGEVFDNGDELAEHVKEAHAGVDVENFECSKCGERFESSADLIAHMSAAHGG